MKEGVIFLCPSSASCKRGARSTAAYDMLKTTDKQPHRNSVLREARILDPSFETLKERKNEQINLNEQH